MGRSNLVGNMLVGFLDSSCLVVVLDFVFLGGRFLELVFVLVGLEIVFFESLVASRLVVLRACFVRPGLA